MRLGYTAAAVREAEAPLLAAGRGEALMRAAAAGLASVCRRLLSERGQIPGSRVVMLVGAGNNGGDALYAGANLAARGAHVTAVDVFGKQHPAGSAAFISAGGRTEAFSPETAAVIAAQLRRADLVIDGVLGTGAKPGLPDDLVSLIRDWQGSAASSQFVVAVDVPTGVDASTGACGPTHVRATHTVTFGADKAGLLLPGGADAAGEVTMVDIGLDMSPHVPAVHVPDDAALATLWPRPQAGDHKYSRGVLGLVAGSARFPGAGVLTASAAVATGVGMLRLLAPAEVTETVLQTYPEVVTDAGRVQAWAIGPGAPDRLTMQHAITAAESQQLPLVIDAGGLSLLTRPLETSCILTPHAGELAELLARLGTGAPSRSEVEAEPVTHAVRAAQVLEAIVLLKGNRTIIARPDGTVVAPEPGPATLATAGTGDVLTGILGTLLATTHGTDIDLADLAGLAVLMHARAGAHATHASHLPAALEADVLAVLDQI
ncbi:NAD(P)H-hydrate dehydratase [Brevibacterium luteolum]|uniref:NAD(P)H-hydrate dehydratase n=1 Tax=Brevibacterium luteolum TaxID=199591 RepID=UPI0021AF6192|nr:NAD(P)H-hydrate dehydratase [Brevibacterium luteolum]MCT1873480.1 NAD(P)H-hydrate dehydratase [Brevibacterium luteolum]MCT1890868.1 NAD(P)H-hydrate dehydratase [Brevibacterium luteolum]MCT1893336.1 NAD(P)H-hydrate dehydratase [Brevibacterium luteolum]MCT1924096.1 NAD(P)H-hydrate dehydratase [Brevibacterium luteolum]